MHNIIVKTESRNEVEKAFEWKMEDFAALRLYSLLQKAGFCCGATELNHSVLYSYVNADGDKLVSVTFSTIPDENPKHLLEAFTEIMQFFGGEYLTYHPDES